ncbi:MAG TPA: hypothetical protein VLI65_06235, partial [Pyrinomonadaceae bacterium]|nr:hypothetical protein [Pyrinomonadaceae bacterium]
LANMSTPGNSNPLKCANGHEQPAGATRFCIYCGTPLVSASQPQAPPMPAVPQSAPPAVPVQQFNVQPPLQPVPVQPQYQYN